LIYMSIYHKFDGVELTTNLLQVRFSTHCTTRHVDGVKLTIDLFTSKMPYTLHH